MVRGLTVNENVVTPHRIKLCPEPTMSPARVCSPAPARLSIKPSRKYRTRRRIQLISPVKTENEALQQIIETAAKEQIKTVKNRSRPLKNSNANTDVVSGQASPRARAIRNARNSQSHKLTEYFDVDKAAPSPVNVPAPAKVTKVNSRVSASHKLTEYFPVRRSVRKTSKCVLAEKRRDLESAIRERRQDGLAVTMFEGKGRGVVATREFCRGDFVVEYEGDLVSVTEARERELHYARDVNTGCYMYYFRHGEQQYCIDATAETGRLGRLVNHSRSGNLLTKAVWVDGAPHLVLLAAHHIAPGEELTYDYGDRSKESLEHHPWLAL